MTPYFFKQHFGSAGFIDSAICSGIAQQYVQMSMVIVPNPCDSLILLPLVGDADAECDRCGRYVAETYSVTPPTQAGKESHLSSEKLKRYRPSVLRKHTIQKGHIIE